MTDTKAPECVCAETSASELSETAKVLATSVWSAYYIDSPAFETNRELFKHAFECGHARASEDMGAELKRTVSQWQSASIEWGKERAQLTEQLAAAQADLKTAYDVLNNDKSYLAITEPLRKQRDAAELKAAEYEKCLDRTLARISGMAMTNFPINVRELDGSISHVRTKTSAGDAYDDIREVLAAHRRGGE